MKIRELFRLLRHMGQGTQAPSGLSARIMSAAQAVDLLPTGTMTEAAEWDIALPLAAASDLQGPMRIPTQGGKYRIVVRRSLSHAQQGVITVEVTAPYRTQLEGHSIILRDGQGRVLVQGRIVNGEVSQIVQDLTGLIPRFVVEPA